MAKRTHAEVLNRRLREYAAAVRKNPGFHAERTAQSVAAIEEHLAAPSVDGMLSVAIELDSLSIVAGVVGVAAVLEGKPEGWAELQACYAYIAWDVRLCFHLFRRGRLQTGWSFMHHNLAARCLAHAMAVRDDAFVDSEGRTLLANFTTGVGLYERAPRAFEPFMLHLFARWKKLPSPRFVLPTGPLGVYGTLLDAWDDALAFDAAVLALCDYHVEMSHEGRVAHAEFTRTPHNVLPAEIWALQRVREEAGFPWTPVEHPLTTSPVGTLPVGLPPLENQLVRRIAAAARTVFGEA